MDLSPGTQAALCGAALAAGFVDAIAGGGGLVTLPALLSAGIPVDFALGTNKGQSVFGSLAATARFAAGGKIDGRRALVLFPLGFAGSLLGAWLVLRIPSESLRPIVLVLLPAAAIAVLLRPTPAATAPGAPARNAGPVAAALALLIGTYDGFFGPGTGTFLILGFVGLLRWSPVQASAEAKVVNFASNLAAVLVFAARGAILWRVALPMAAAQFAGGLLGAHSALRVGDRLVRGAVALVVAGLMVKIALDLI